MSADGKHKYLVTGSKGFIGSYIVKQLIDEGHEVVGFDNAENNTIIQQVLEENELKEMQCEIGDASNFKFVKELVESVKPHYVIHLAGLQIPTCRANPPLGASVNVCGTVNIFEASRQVGTVRGISYASSAAVCGPPDDYRGSGEAVLDDERHVPRTHYGVFKLANEGNARIFFQDHKIPSVGLRPLTVFGVGREIGLTSDPTKAIKSAVAGKEDYVVKFSGSTVWNYVKDVARLFIECARAVAEKPGAYACNIKGESLSVADFLQAVSKVTGKDVCPITDDAITLPFPDVFDEKLLADLLGRPAHVTTLEDAVQETVDHFRSLKEDGKFWHTNDLN